VQIVDFSNRLAASRTLQPTLETERSLDDAGLRFRVCLECVPLPRVRDLIDAGFCATFREPMCCSFGWPLRSRHFSMLMT